MFDSTIQKLKALEDADDAVVAVLVGVKQALADWQAKSNLTPADKASFDALEAQIQADAAKMVAAIAAPTTPAASAPVVAALPDVAAGAPLMPTP
jgi:hypothetical protein